MISLLLLTIVFMQFPAILMPPSVISEYEIIYVLVVNFACQENPAVLLYSDFSIILEVIMQKMF